MRSRGELAPVMLLAVILSAGIAATPVRAAGSPPTDAEVAAAVKKVKADPALAAERTVRSLEWKNSADRKKREPKKSWLPDWLSGIGDFFGWAVQGAAWLVYAVLAALVAWLIIFLVRLFWNSRGSFAKTGFVAPTHVQDLDIRPESLPPDVGAAARKLWDAGEHRAALALLYRGTISRLVHVHEVPIRDSSTEGDCLRLAAAKLAERPLDYTARLIQVWQGATYGGLEIDTATVHELCAGFGPNLDAASAPADGGLAGAAA